MPDSALVNLIRRGARARGLDPEAVLRVASVEGLSGKIGDGGHAYGPFQLNNAGGVITNRFPGTNRQDVQDWATRPAGVNYALDGIDKVAHGLHGAEAVKAIVTGFERPKDPQGEISRALGTTPLSSAPTATPLAPRAPAGNGGRASQLAALVASTNQQFGLGSGTGLQELLASKLAGATPPRRAMQPGADIGGTGSTAAIHTAESYLGTPYEYGGNDKQGIDCSALLQKAWAGAGVNIPRTTYEQYKTGKPVKTDQLEPGDAVFFRGSDPRGDLPGHVGIYLGNGKFMEAPHTGATVRISTLAGRSDFVGARRYG